MSDRTENILVTGATGFVGAAVTRLLVSQGRRIALLLRPTSDTRRIVDLLDRVTVIRGDFFCTKQARVEVSTFRPDAVVHLAWSLVQGNDRNKVEQVDNIAASVELYQVAKDLGCKRFVGMGSQGEYGPSPAKIAEDTPARPTTVYGAAKLATYLLLDRLAEADGVKFAWLRLFSSYGPGDHASWLIPYLALTLLSGNRPALTKCEQMWDYIYIDDVASAVISTLDSDAVGAFNLGSGKAVPLYDIVTKLRDLIDPSLPLGFGQVRYRPDQVMHLEADITALCAATRWQPLTNLDAGLRHTVNWYRSAAE